MGKAQKYAIVNLVMAMIVSTLMLTFIAFLFASGQGREVVPDVMKDAVSWLIAIIIGIMAGALMGKSADDVSGYHREFVMGVAVYAISLILAIGGMLAVDLGKLSPMLQLVMFINFSIRSLRLFFAIKESNGCTCPPKSVGP